MQLLVLACGKRFGAQAGSYGRRGGICFIAFAYLRIGFMH